MKATDPADSPSASHRQIVGLSLLFGILYFIQGIAEPTEGLIAQPVRSMLAHQGMSTTRIGFFAALIALPWSFKILYGLLTDFVPIAGSRRRPYLILSSSAATIGLLAVWMFPTPRVYPWLLLALIIPTIGVAFADVVADALMVETGKPLGLTSLFQSVQWGSSYLASILTGVVGGHLSQIRSERSGFLICGLFALVSLLLAVFVVREPRRPADTVAPKVSQIGPTFLRVLKIPGVLWVSLFLFLCNFNPLSSAVIQTYSIQRLGFSEAFFGLTNSVLAVGAIAACVLYGAFGGGFPLRGRLHAAILTGMACNLVYYWMTDRSSGLIVSAIVGFTYMLSSLIQFDLAARIAPPEFAGTVFALMMGVSNLGLIAGTAVGGDWYDRGVFLWSPRTSFLVLGAAGAGFTSLCWLIVPFMRLDEAASAPPKS